MTEPVADLRHLSTRLPEDETGGDPQTGEGAVRLDDRAGDRVAGDPALLPEFTAEPGESLPSLPNSAYPADAAPLEPATPEQSASVPLIPADNPPEQAPAPSTEE